MNNSNIDSDDDQETEIQKLETKLKTVTKKYKAKIRKLKDDIDGKDEEIDELKRKLKKIKKTKSRKENSDSETSLDGVTVELQKTKEELNSIREELKLKDDIISEKEKSIESINNHAENLTDEIRNLNEQLKKSLNDLKIKNAEIDKFSEDIESKIIEIKKLEQTNEEFINNSKDIEDFESKSENYKRNLKSKDEELNKLKEEIESLKSQKSEDNEKNSLSRSGSYSSINEPTHKSNKLLNEINKRTKNEFDSLDDCISFINKFSNNSRKKGENDSDQDETSEKSRNRDKVKQLNMEINELNDKIDDLEYSNKSSEKKFKKQLKSKDQEIEKLEKELELAITKKPRNSKENSFSRSESDRSIGESLHQSKKSLLNDINKRTGKTFDSLDDCISFIKKLSNNTDKKEEKDLYQDENFEMSTDGNKVKQLVIKIEKLNDKIYELEFSKKSFEKKFQKQLKLKDQEMEDLQEDWKSVETQKSRGEIQIKALDETIRELKVSIESRIEEINSKDIKLKERESRVQELEEDTNQLKKYNMELTQAIHDKNKEIEGKVEDLKKKNFALQTMIEKIKQNKSDFTELNKTVAQNMADLEFYRNALLDKKDGNENIKNVSNMEQKIQRLEDEINHIKVWKFKLPNNQEKDNNQELLEIKTKWYPNWWNEHIKGIQPHIEESNENIDENVLSRSESDTSFIESSPKSNKSMLNEINKRTGNKFDDLDDCISFITKLSNTEKISGKDCDQNEKFRGTMTSDKSKHLELENEDLHDKIYNLEAASKNIEKKYKKQLIAKQEEIEELQEELASAKIQKKKIKMDLKQAINNQNNQIDKIVKDKDEEIMRKQEAMEIMKNKLFKSNVEKEKLEAIIAQQIIELDGYREKIDQQKMNQQNSDNYTGNNNSLRDSFDNKWYPNWWEKHIVANHKIYKQPK